ncbi:MAG: alpha/beta hydrolase [Lachnospiraceae bacterium]|nr:alpha/beta hydrolase [Lachnospiraceae bacterium]
MEKQHINIGKETLAYLDRGQGEAVLLLHGNMSSSLHFTPLFEGLGEGFRLIAPDLRGFGDSSYNEAFDSLGELAEDVNLFMEALELPTAYVAGWSTGGGIALELAARHPEKVKKLFAIEGAGHKGYPIFQKDAAFQSTGRPYESKEAMAQDPLQVAPMLPIFATQNAAAMEAIWKASIYPLNQPAPEQSALWIGETLKQRCLVDLDWALATFNMSEETGPYGPGDGSIRQVACPCAFTSGDKDMVVPPYMVQENVTALRDRARLIAYENCGHSPLVDCPDRLVKDIKEFFC